MGDPERDRQRIEALAAEKPLVSAAAAVRSDYFGTAEHKTLAECLKAILEGKDVIGVVDRQAASHVLLHRTARAPGLTLADAPLSIGDLTVSGSSDASLQSLQRGLKDVLDDYDPHVELYVRSGLTLRYGEVIALAGDYFASPEELRDELTPGVASAIRNITPKKTGTFVLNTHRGWFDYLALANKNQVHFSPRNWVTYARYHAQALKHALMRSYDEAMFANAFADHFLSDAFASGHLRVPREDLAGLKGAPASRTMHNEENEHGLWVQDLAGEIWRAYGDDNLGRNPIHVFLTAYAIGVSQQRIHRAYRLEGAAAAKLTAAIDAGLAALPVDKDDTEWAAGLWRSPADLPDFLGEIADLPDIRARLPVALGSKAAAEPGTLANYEPLRSRKKEGGMAGRKAAPDFLAFFDLQTLMRARA